MVFKAVIAFFLIVATCVAKDEYKPAIKWRPKASTKNDKNLAKSQWEPQSSYGVEDKNRKFKKSKRTPSSYKNGTQVWNFPKSPDEK